MTDKLMSRRESLSEIWERAKTMSLPVAEATTGAALSNRQDFVEIAGHLVQSQISGRVLEQLFREFEQLRAKGKIKPDYGQSEQALDTFSEIFKFIGSKKPSSEKLKAIKNFFLNVAQEKHSTRDDVFVQQYLDIVFTLSVAELNLMKSAWMMRGQYGQFKNNNEHTFNILSWKRHLVDAHGYPAFELVDRYSDDLVSKKLFYQDTGSHHVELTEYGALTRLGAAICEFLSDPAG